MTTNQFESKENIPSQKNGFTERKENIVQKTQNTTREKVFHIINKEEVYKKLSDALLEISMETNESLGEDFVDDEARVKMKGYQEIPKYERIADNAEIERLKSIWAEENIDRQQFIQQKKLHGRSREEVTKKMTEEFINQKNLDRGSLLEMAITTIFYKILKEKFLVVRTSVYDDYKRGADNLIVDKQTGNPICAFDEVHDSENGNRYQDKMNKLREKAQKGGTEVKYGATFQNGKLLRRTLFNIPTFYLGVSPDQFNGLLQNMEYDPSLPPTEKELEIFDMLTSSLEKQIKIMEPLVAYSQNEKNPKKMEEKKRAYRNLQKFRASLETMKKIRKELK